MFHFRYHPKFSSDLKKLNSNTQERVFSKIKDVRQDPTRFKHLGGKMNSYSARIGDLRLIYFVDGDIIEFVIIEQRKNVYDIYRKRLGLVREELVEYGSNNS